MKGILWSDICVKKQRNESPHLLWMLVLSLLSVAVVIDKAVVVVVVGGGGGGDVTVSYLVYFRSVILSMVNNV